MGAVGEVGEVGERVERGSVGCVMLEGEARECDMS